MSRRAILSDEITTAEYDDQFGGSKPVTKEIQVPDHAPRELIQPQRITGECQDGVEYIYRLRGINKAGIASYAYHSCRRVQQGFSPKPRMVLGEG